MTTQTTRRDFLDKLDRIEKALVSAEKYIYLPNGWVGRDNPHDLLADANSALSDLRSAP